MWDDITIGDQVQNYFTSTEGNIRYIFAPFIQKNALKRVIPDSDFNTIIVTRWRLADLASGVSDPEVFKLCQEKGYTLKIHSQIHAKVYSWDLETALIGSANLTKSGMEIGKHHNVEVMSSPIQLSTQDQIKLRKAEKVAQLVTQEDYERALESIENAETLEPNYDNIDIGKDPEFLISQLPMTEDPNIVIAVLAEDHHRTLNDFSSNQQRCILHDIAAYSLDDLKGRNEAEVRTALKKRFKNHSFINMIIDNIDPCIYFGEMKALVQEKCADVPTPSRRELTGNVQVLYNWFPEIDPGKFRHDIPGRHSERLCDLEKIDAK